MAHSELSAAGNGLRRDLQLLCPVRDNRPRHEAIHSKGTAPSRNDGRPIVQTRKPEPVTQDKRAAKSLKLLTDHITSRRAVLVSCAARLLGGNVDDAEEAVQEAFLRASVGVEHYDGSASISTWFAVILRRTCYRLYRKNAQFMGDLEDEENRGATLTPLFASGTDILVAQAAESGLHAAWDHLALHEDAVVMQALLAVPTLQRALLTRAYILQEEQADIALDWGVTAGALRVRLSYARQLLRRECEKLTQKGN